ncbi:MAG: sulfatase [Adhaeribacter sp.]
MKKSFLKLALLLPLLTGFTSGPATKVQPAAARPAASQAATRPNIVIIMADDLDSRQLSCYGGQNIQTRHIDALARQGLQFNHIYASEAMCIPTRASLFTGLYPVRHGAYQNHKPVKDNLKSVGHYLGDLGYRVGLTGKNHVTKPVSVFPFEIVKGLEPNCVAPTDDYQLEDVRRFITGAKDPYCLFVMSINPHAPWTVGNPAEFDPDKLKLPPTWVDTKEARSEFCKYLAEVRRLDDQVGDMMKLLRETGQDKNTVVIFLGEQGPQFPGGKWNLWDYGQKSSMIVSWPGQVKAGSQTPALVQYEDITPTLVEIAGGKAIAGLDGKSMLPVLRGKSQQHRQYTFGIHNNIPEGPAYPIRSIRDTRYKLVMNLSPEKDYHIKYYMNGGKKNVLWNSWVAEAANPGRARHLTQRVIRRPALEFYDMEKDPWEQHNLAASASHQQLIARYSAELKNWMKQQGDAGAALDVEFQRH